MLPRRAKERRKPGIDRFPVHAKAREDRIEKATARRQQERLEYVKRNAEEEARRIQALEVVRQREAAQQQVIEVERTSRLKGDGHAFVLIWPTVAMMCRLARFEAARLPAMGRCSLTAFALCR